MLKLLSITILPVVIVHSFFFFLTQVTDNVSLTQLYFELITPFLLLVINYKLAYKKDKSYFIPNFFLILISSLLGIACGYLNWGLHVVNDLTKRIALLDPDNETIAVDMALVAWNVIVSTIGSVLCSAMLILKNQRNGRLDNHG